MIEAVENHTPEVIVVDEIGTEAEAQAARTIAERGVMLIATAHGNSLESLIKTQHYQIWSVVFNRLLWVMMKQNVVLHRKLF